MCYVIVVLWLAAWGIMGGAGSAATLPGSMSLALNPVDGDRVGGMQASRTVAGGVSTNPTATPSDPFTYAVPHSPVSLTFFNYGAPVPRNPALICLGAAENDFWERVGGSKLDKPVGQTLEYRVQRVHLTVIPVGGVRGLRWRSIRPMVLGLRYFVNTYGAMDMLFDISVEGMGTGRVGTGRLTTV